MSKAVGVTDSSFESDVLKSEVAILVDFWAEWCGPCRALGPKLDEVASELGDKVKVVKMNVDENPQTPSKYGIQGIPTMIIFKSGEVVEKLVGNLPKDKILESLSQHL